jgi:hypothetical protein
MPAAAVVAAALLLLLHTCACWLNLLAASSCA